MNIVDSCGWLEYLADGPDADFFSFPLFKTEQLVVPIICIYEVFKKVLAAKGENLALQTMALMQQGLVVEIDSTLAIEAARLSQELKLPMADSFILATARAHNAIIWTQDQHFKNVSGVKYKIKRKSG
ncbi:MAG TPA: type II toxin-antitoxin system VapC family toxin [Candidatus Rifleibacterium sp.]|jgi:predicted nucleic acid-binding protein|nr:type II toxin-antitoxin system VapC family toxin [Candidatus Rifleibacterium sp.]HOI90126.1 type II toxin-antitoxin system VapC family toxin [Candidatus Rifleibacterium sp.]HPW59181.1 type II toxin-antitoxin system VapC family toxin [Candidatus Rifleibacterium sp.]